MIQKSAYIARHNSMTDFYYICALFEIVVIAIGAAEKIICDCMNKTSYETDLVLILSASVDFSFTIPG